MASFSLFCCSGRQNLRLLLTNFLRSSSNYGCAGKSLLPGGARQMATHKRIMVITPSRFQWHKFKDEFHFYTMLGAIPLGLIIIYANVFIGPAELAEIPEDYEPKNWEYYKHPISRFFARYVYNSEQQEYEKMMHWLCEKEELRQMRLLERKVKLLMAERGDYKAWHYRPFIGLYHRLVRKHHEDGERRLHGIN